MPSVQATAPVRRVEDVQSPASLWGVSVEITTTVRGASTIDSARALADNRSVAIVAYRARTDLRSGWRGTLVLVILVSLAASLGVAGVAGARRGWTAGDRLIAEVGRPDLIAYDVGEAPLDAVMGIDGATAYSATFILADAVEPAGPIVAFANSDLSIGGQLVTGSFPETDDATGAVIDQRAAKVLNLAVGDPLVLGADPGAQLEVFDFSGPKGPEVEVTVRAIVREPDDITPGDPAADEQVGYVNDGGIYLPLSFLDRYGDAVGTVNTSIAFVVDEGVTTGDLVAAIRGLPGGETVQFFSPPGFDPATRRAVQIEAISLLLVSGLLVLAPIGRGDHLRRIEPCDRRPARPR